MSNNLKIAIILVGFSLIFIVALILKKGRMPVKYSLIWFLSAAIILLVGVVPEILWKVSSVLGFATIANMITGAFILILLLITMSLTIIVSGQKKKITLLIQEVSMLKEKLNGK